MMSFRVNLLGNSPGYWILFLVLAPFIWYVARDSLTGLGRVRRYVALMLRTLLLFLIVAALAEVQFLRINEGLTVIYLLDQSESIPRVQREAMLNYVREDVAQHRNQGKRDRAGVIVFGRNASIEISPIDDNLQLGGRLESTQDLGPDATNLAEAVKLAQATFREDSGRRIVIVSDGNENEGDAQAVAELIARDGVGVDVVPVTLKQRAEIEVDKIAIPADAHQGQPFDANVVLNNLAQPTTQDDGAVQGKLRVWRRQGRDMQQISEQPVTLPPGKTVLQFRNTIDEPDFYEYQAEFVADNPHEDDALTQNNRATAFTQVMGAANVLLIEDWEHPGEFQTLIDRLREQEIQITVQPSDQLFSSLAELQRYDCIILGNVARSSGTVDTQTNFSDEQIAALVQNTQRLGCGLIMLGGPTTFGAGGWANTELEKAMPVDFQIYDAKVVPVGALAMVMHASEMAQGNYWQKVISREALKVLGPNDYCGVIHWENKEAWLWDKGLAQVGTNKDRMMAMLGRMTPGDMPDFDPSLKMAAAKFAMLPPGTVKHMIVISDGDPTPPTRATLQTFKDLPSPAAKISTVAVGTHGAAGSTVLQNIAKFTGGKYYVAKNPNALPRIFQKESMRIARPLVLEKPGLQPSIDFRHEILRGIESVPPIDGFVLTSKKEASLVDIIMTSPEPASRDNATLMAAWQFGAGRTAVFTSDAGHRWATAWTEWDGYNQFFGQLIRWAMRPSGDRGKFSLATQIKEGKAKVIITALDTEDNLLNFLEIAGDVIRPDMSSEPIKIAQVAPGRYEAEFDAKTPGSYFVSLAPGAEMGILRTGLSVPYSAEYRDRETNEALLKSLASLKPKGGQAGKLINVSFEPGEFQVPEIDTFRRDLAKPISMRDIWPVFVFLGCCLFLADIFVRRVAIPTDWIRPFLARAKARWFGGEVPAVPDERMARLRSRKAEVVEAIDERKAATRFEPSPDGPVDMSILDQAEQLRTTAQEKQSQRDSLAASQPEEDDYTARLLKAKQQARKQQPPSQS